MNTRTMNIFGRATPLALFALTCLLCATPVVAEDEPDLSLWSDQAHLEKHLALACDAVEQISGAKFTERPKIALTTSDELKEILNKELGATFVRLGHGTAAQVEALMAQTALMLAAKCEPERNLIHVLPENVERIVEILGSAELVSPDMLRVLLAHEATHALDFQRYGDLDKARRERKTMEGVQAVGAVLEGHAQFVAKRVAKAWKIDSAFDRLVDLTISSPPTSSAAERVMADVMLAEQRFAYVEGHAFFEAVFAARGQTGVDEVLAHPPETVRVIERPEEYLKPRTESRELDFAKVSVPAAALAKELGWNTQNLRLKRVQIDAIFAMLPSDRRKPVLDAYQDGWAFVFAKTQAELATVIVTDLATPAGAELYVELTEELLRLKDEQMKAGPIHIKSAKYEQGTGPEAKLPGLVCTKIAAVGSAEQVVVVHFLPVGRYGLEITFVQPPVERERQNALVQATHDALAAEADGGGALVGKADRADAVALEALAEEFGRAQLAEDRPRLLALAAALCPTSAELASVCRPGPETDAFLAAYKGPKDMTADAHAKALLDMGNGVFRSTPEQTQIGVHASTTEEINAYAKGTTAFAEFPGGMRRFAAKVAAPGRTWYVVEITEPGKGAGRKFTCFTKVGGRFVIITRPWRAMPRPSDDK